MMVICLVILVIPEHSAMRLLIPAGSLIVLMRMTIVSLTIMIAQVSVMELTYLMTVPIVLIQLTLMVLWTVPESVMDYLM